MTDGKTARHAFGEAAEALAHALADRLQRLETSGAGMRMDADAVGRAMVEVMGAFAEFERALIHERQREGIALAKQRGTYKGRKRPSPPRPSCSCARASRPASARPKSPESLASAGKPSISIGRRVTALSEPRPL